MPHKPYTIGIVGGSASGKTSFLRDLLTRLPAQSCSVVSQDNYYRAIHEQTCDANGQPNFDLPTAIQRERFHEDLGKLLCGESISRTEYTFNHSKRQGRLITVEPAYVLMIEGLFVFHFEEVRNLIDLRVFVDAREDICKQRRMQRDLHERGYPPHEVEYQWEQHVMPAYRQYVLPFRDEAHLIVTNHTGYDKGLEVVTDHVLAKLGKPSREA
jgi:uridine kinase